MRQLLIAWVATGILAGLSGRSEAEYIQYFDRASFEAAAGAPLATADFDGLVGNTYQILSHAIAPTIPEGVTFSSTPGNSSDLFVAPPGLPIATAITSPSLFANNFGAPLIVDFASPVTAVGTDVIPFDGQNSSATITINVYVASGLSTSFTVTPPAGVADFLGVIATDGDTISRITFTPPDGFTAGVDHVAFGIASVPEPPAFALSALGGLGLACLARLRRRLPA